MAGLLSLAVFAGCRGSIPVPLEPQIAGTRVSPLGPSYVLVALPGDDDSLLGRLLAAPPTAGRTLDEVAQPNPCADKLAPVTTSPSTNLFEDAHDVSGGGKAGLVLGTFGFGADAEIATHFLYRIQTDRQATRLETTEYLACCNEKNSCGFGFVSSLVYGEGEYATGKETGATEGHNVVNLATAGGNIAIRKLHTRKVRGWLAAIVKPADPGTVGQPTPLGIAAITEASVGDDARASYQSQQVALCDDKKANGSPTWVLCTKSGPITEREFARRYKTASGASDLEGIDSIRAPRLVYGGGAVAVVGVGLITAGVIGCRSLPASDGTPEGRPANDSAPALLCLVGLQMGLIAALVGGTLFLEGLSRAEGTPQDHKLTEYDARRYAGRYNRTLLRRAVPKAQSNQKDVSWRLPIIGGGPLLNGGGALTVAFAF